MSTDRVALVPTPAFPEEILARARPWTDAELVPASYPVDNAVDLQNVFATPPPQNDKQVNSEVP